MPRRLSRAALTALLVAPAALAAQPANLTIYHADDASLFSGTAGGPQNAGHALVHEQYALTLTAGTHAVQIGGLPVSLDPESIEVGLARGASVRGQRIVLARTGTESALDAAIGSQVEVLTDSSANGGATTALTGTLLGASDAGVLVRSADGKLHLVHAYASITLPPEAASAGSTLLLEVDAKSAGKRTAKLTYMTAGIGWRAAYTATLLPGDACRMQFKPDASIANRSGRDYRAAGITLVAGKPNLGNAPVRRYAMATPMAAAALPHEAPLGDYRSFTLPGPVDLPDGTVTLTPLYAPGELACQRQYIVSDGSTASPPHPNINDYGAQDYQNRPIPSTLAFTAPAALPAGTLRAWTRDPNGAPALLGQGALPDTPKGQAVAVQLGQSFDLRASRERTAFHVDARAHVLTESWRITLANTGATPRTVTLREHPDRWREWTLTESSRTPSKQTTQLLEFEVPVPANGKATLTYSIRYHWTAQDL